MKRYLSSKRKLGLLSFFIYFLFLSRGDDFQIGVTLYTVLLEPLCIDGTHMTT